MEAEKASILQEFQSSMGTGAGLAPGSTNALDFEKLFSILNRSLWWIIFFILLSLLGAYLFLRYTKPNYESYSILKMEVEQKADMLGLRAGTLNAGGESLQGEIEIIKSALTAQKVIDSIWTLPTSS
jgi:tyrosine-protein kinase Etk/Wzc